MVTFKENYDVRVESETPYSSGIFTFLKGTMTLYTRNSMVVLICLYIALTTR